MRYLGIDYGERRIGLSFGDEIGVAVPLTAAAQSSEQTRLEEISALVKSRRVDELVIGYPLNMDGSSGFKVDEVDAFIRRLEECFGLPVHRVDERLSTKTATEHLPKGRNDELRRSGKIDSMAACIILQDFLDRHVHGATDAE
jgi:putative Holliday junction resolvase